MTVGWLADNFAEKEYEFYMQLINGKPGKVLPVPEGASREDIVTRPLRVESAPIVKYEQNGKPTCVVCSFASALFASGDVQYAEVAHSWMDKSLWINIGKRTHDSGDNVYRDRLGFVVEKTRRRA